MKNTLHEMIHFLTLLFLFIFIYALLGMELYGNLIKFDADGNPI